MSVCDWIFFVVVIIIIDSCIEFVVLNCVGEDDFF